MQTTPIGLEFIASLLLQNAGDINVWLSMTNHDVKLAATSGLLQKKWINSCRPQTLRRCDQ
jgi:hypothetical protein